jgi:hypothetical protein
MIKKTLFFLAVIFIFNSLVFISDATWFIYFPKEQLYIISGFCIILQLLPYFHFRNGINDSLRLKQPLLYIYGLLLISLASMVFLPIRNLNLGDGILLLEHVALEAKMFGYHLTMDEILEALIHSVLFARFPAFFETPMEAYRLISTLSGVCALGILVYYFRIFHIGFVGYFLILSSGGMYLFHGYSENYTIITTVLWFFILYVINSIRTNKHRNLKALLPICFIACTLILSHLVSGYLLFSLVFLCFHFSDEGKFLRNAFYSTLFSLSILLPVFLYFTLLSDVRFDFTQTHLTNPKFYPLSKIISKTHFRDIFYCILGSAFLPFITLIYMFLFDKKKVIVLFKKREFQFLAFVLLGFFIHGFVHYPQLGFPADWDLLAFFWSPIVFLAVFILDEVYFNQKDDAPIELGYFPKVFFHFFVFAGCIFILNAVTLNKADDEKIAELKNSLTRIDRFSISSESKVLASVKPEYKKFYLKVSFFLFESAEKMKSKNMDSTQVTNLLSENQKFQIELSEHISNIESKWQKDFYSRLTRYHLEYLDLLKKK